VSNRISAAVVRWAITVGLAAAAPALAQSITWRIPEYGVGASVAGTPRQSLAFDATGNLYAFAETVDANGTGLRLQHYQSPAGDVLWQRDFPSLLGTIAWGFSTAALTSVGEDAVVTTTDYDTHLFARIARVRGSDGAILWQSERHGSEELVLHAAAFDTTGDILAAGSVGPYNGPILGRVAKFRGSDGENVWNADVDPTLCGMTPPTAFHLVDIATDSHADVLVVGMSVSDALIAFCAFKLDGNSGAMLWWHGEPRNGGVGLPHLAVDGNGNVVIGTANGGSPSVLVKLNGASGELVWGKDALPSNTLFALDTSGNVIVSADATRAYAATDGHALWPQDSPLAGTPVVSAGVIVLASSEPANSRIRFAGLDVQNGSPLWNSIFDVGTQDYWNSLALAADQNGHFAALQADTLCCVDRQLLTIAGETASGALDWHASDPLAGISQALLEEPNPYLRRMSALTADGGVITAGTAYPGFETGVYVGSDAHVLVSKRAVHDGHLIWSRTVDAGLNSCRPAQLVLDSNGDALVAATCSGVPQVIKIRGSDGIVLWTGASMSNCNFATVESVAVDAANDAYATGGCDAAQLTVKYEGATGAEKWKKLTAAEPSEYSAVLAVPAAGEGVILGTTFRLGEPNVSAYRIVVSKLHADGSSAWTHSIDPPQNSSYDLRALAVYPGGDIAVSGVADFVSAHLVRIDGSNGLEKWAIDDTDVSGIGITLDSGGNILIAGHGGVAKYAAASGTRQWLFPHPANDLTLDLAGNVLATGACAPEYLKLCVVDINSLTGSQLWQAADADYPQNSDFGIGVLAPADGGILVTAQFAVPGASPWTLVRLAGPLTDGLLANGFEP